MKVLKYGRSINDQKMQKKVYNGYVQNISKQLSIIPHYVINRHHLALSYHLYKPFFHCDKIKFITKFVVVLILTW